ncbi:MAG: radical SAM protein [Firmicutes bacterium]|nr:radical SAM protein [Bacillota bacterium]
MIYEGIVYRPPSESRSLIIQITVGCSYNRCTYCNMYKKKVYKTRDLDLIIEDMIDARDIYDRVDKIFLADGNGLVVDTYTLTEILKSIKKIFPECNSVSIYATPKDVLDKSQNDLKLLKDMGLKLIYMGIESGSDKVLVNTNKGINSKELIQAGQKVKKSGIILSTMIISGLGGKKEWIDHAEKTAMVLNEIQPDYLALMTLMVKKGTVLYDEVREGEFQVLNKNELLKETLLLIKSLELNNCIIRSNHASNNLVLKGDLPKDKMMVISEIEKNIIKEKNVIKLSF